MTPGELIAITCITGGIIAAWMLFARFLRKRQEWKRDMITPANTTEKAWMLFYALRARLKGAWRQFWLK